MLDYTTRRWVPVRDSKGTEGPRVEVEDLNDPEPPLEECVLCFKPQGPKP